jgi:isochorismate hydrolase
LQNVFEIFFSKFCYWFKDVQVVRVIIPGKDNKVQTSQKYEASQRGYLNERAINRYFNQFDLCFILSHMKLVGLT